MAWLAICIGMKRNSIGANSAVAALQIGNEIYFYMYANCNGFDIAAFSLNPFHITAPSMTTSTMCNYLLPMSAT